MKAEHLLRRLVRVSRVFDAVKNWRQLFKLRQIVLFQHKAQAQALHRLPRLKQGLDLVLAHGSAVVAHYRDQGLYASLASVIADKNTLTGLYLHKAQLFKLNEPRRYDRAAHAHFQGELTGRRKLLPDGKLAREYHILYLLNKKICH